MKSYQDMESRLIEQGYFRQESVKRKQIFVWQKFKWPKIVLAGSASFFRFQNISKTFAIQLICKVRTANLVTVIAINQNTVTSVLCSKLIFNLKKILEILLVEH